MENASKALIMAASILLGVMIISIGVVLYNSFSDFSRSTAQKMQEKQIAEWNNTYLKYYGKSYTENAGKAKDIKVTAHDIISVINSAYQNNVNYFGQDTRTWNSYAGKENYYYVQIDVNTEKNAEKWDEQKKINFLQENRFQEGTREIKYFKAKRVDISNVTKRVYKMTFEDY